MAANGARSSRRSRTAKAGGEPSVDKTVDRTGGNRAEAAVETAVEAVEMEETMAEQEKATSNGDTATKPGKMELAQKPEAETNGREERGLALRTESGDIQVAETFTSAGLRPIAASHMEVFGTILNNRPIMASHLRVLDYSIPGHRPIFASEIVVRDDLTLPGGRPIVASDPKLLEASLLMGGRPIASNEIDDSEVLMGFID